MELSDISSPDWYIASNYETDIEHKLTFTANDKEVYVYMNFKGIWCIQSWTNEHKEEVVPDYDTAIDFIFNAGIVRLGTDFDDEGDELVEVHYYDNKELKEVFLGLLEAVGEKLL